MSVHSGFLYYFDGLGLDRDTYRVHYRFVENSGTLIPNSAPDFPQLSGQLSSVGDFYNQAGSGFFTGQKITIQNPTGLPSDVWTHLFIAQKTGAGRNVLFDSLVSGEIMSGYVIGINDANKLYFESYDQNGPFSKTSSIMLGKKNVAAVVRANNLLTFYCFDFNNDTILSENQEINGDFMPPAAKGIIGSTFNVPNYIQTGDFRGYIDEYVFLQEAITPSTFRYLVSGLCSDYTEISGAVTYFTGVEVTGYTNVITGVTGVTGYQNQITGSGLDPFGTGNYRYFWGTVAQTGYLVSGLQVVPLTGEVVRSVTGDSTASVQINQEFIKAFDLDEVSYIRKIDSDDISMLSTYPIFSPKLNLEGGYDNVLGRFQLDRVYETSQIEVYLNGMSQLDTGFAVTGNFYGSGVVLSGDYRLDGFYIDSTGFYSGTDVVIYDCISGTRTRIEVSGIQSGQSEAIAATGDFIYFNGQLLLSGLDYVSTTGQFTWASNKYSGENGALLAFPTMPFLERITGSLLSSLTGNVPRRNSQLFLNGQRQQINRDYIENSDYDLIEQSGIFENFLSFLYNDDENFFEDFDSELALTADTTLFTADTIVLTADMTFY